MSDTKPKYKRVLLKLSGEALAGEQKTGVLVGRIRPGLMITNFINTSNGDGDKFELTNREKKIYNKYGEFPDVVAEYMVPKLVVNRKNNVEFKWLTRRRKCLRKIMAVFSKRDFFW